jgi:lipid-A-disaccharide synthase
VVAGREVAPEFIQSNLTPALVARALEPLLEEGSARRAQMLVDLEAVRRQLGQPGASRRVAAIAQSLAEPAGRPA